ncbi:unnamed protein product [Ambrosiozyma monospora]|uniref:Unnamed protein product n=1 Tax=Ambrosiozyma monospora TaxID=43982 RepID=A0ACB5T940_AMBMO|nr:unnamed protein product [Ambrosiozyma monospora]
MTVENSQSSYVFQKKVNDIGLLCVGCTDDGMSIKLEDPKTKEVKVVFDAVSGAAVSSLPHCDPEITSQMAKFAQDSVYTFGAYFANYAAEELGKFMCENSNGAFASSLFTGSGSESVENAMKIMRQYHLEKGDTKRYKFISRTQSYHGFTIGSLSIGDGSRKPPFKPILLSDEVTPKVTNVYPYRNQKGTEEEYTKQLLAELEQCFIDNDPTTICGVIFETVGGSTIGTPTPPKGYLDGAKALCEKLWFE